MNRSKRERRRTGGEAGAEKSRAAAERDETMPLPPRSTLHPSEKEKLTRLFYRFLFLLFSALTIGLMIWGSRYSS
jgi:hypothetical protein